MTMRAMSLMAFRYEVSITLLRYFERVQMKIYQSPEARKEKLRKGDKAERAYAEVPDHVKEDIEDAIKWAKATLTSLEGDGHQIYVTGNVTGVVCSFAKVGWPGDHCGRTMDHAAEAIVMSVCEYMNGL